ncbi:hypothetical protein FCK90_11030 [Kocuria coralli]|uniref:ABC-type glycine betaine transport system substrate-binding domain-containing protein n=1 Tax=Kocuria coralli TaxID=1461025 RepID=A0A5J5KY05_9MICC|nr:glycine betaine ABC transporter substrate-binding protein [Kocuria coralli]KAA9393706.1 hypothetical protein FCK90_11030 [Kocuria coralli]
MTRRSGQRPRHPWRKAAAAALGTGLLVLSACGDGGGSGDPTPTQEATATSVVVGAGPTQQTQTVAHVWALALEDAGMTVEIRELDGGRAEYLTALEDGEIDLYPDYTGDLYLELRGNAPEGPGSSVDEDPSAWPAATASPSPTETEGNLVDSLANMLGQGQQGVTDEDVESALSEQLPESVQTLDAAPAENKRVLATTAATQARLSLNSIADLADHCGDLTFGAISGEDQASVTSTAIEETYDCAPGEIREFGSQSEVVQALLAGQIDVAAILSATPAIEENSLWVLEDNRHALVPERVIPVAASELSDQAVGEVNGISGQLDTDALVLLTRMTTSSTPYSPGEAAEYWYGTVSE